jgi:hypothetical protein
VSQPLLDVLAFAGGVIAVLVDGRWAVAVASLAAACGLAAAAATFGGGWAAVMTVGAALVAGATGRLGDRFGSRLGRRRGPDPGRPVVRSREALFGPRTRRAAAAAVALPAASWVSFNIPVGSVAAVQGRLFPVAFVFAVGLARLLLARSVSDLGVGLAVTTLSVSVAWFLRGGPDPLSAALGLAALAPVAAGVEAWLLASRTRPLEAPR